MINFRHLSAGIGFLLLTVSFQSLAESPLVLLDAPQERITQQVPKEERIAKVLIRDWYCPAASVTDTFQAEAFTDIDLVKECKMAKELAEFSKNRKASSADYLAFLLELRSAQEILSGAVTERSGPGGMESTQINTEIGPTKVFAPSVTTIKNCYTDKEIYRIFEIRAQKYAAHADKLCQAEKKAKDNGDPTELGDKDEIL